MDDDVQSLSDVLTDSNSEASLTDDIDEKCEASDIDTVEIKFTDSILEIGEYSKGNSKALNTNDLVLDLRNLNRTNDFQNEQEEEEEKYEKLSEVIEEPEEFSPRVTNILDQKLIPSSRCKEISEKSLTLQERISSLKNLMLSLREELRREVCLWRKERDEFQILQEKSDLIALEEATAAARAAAEAYAAESPLSEDLDRCLQYNCSNNFIAAGEILDVNPEQTLSELTILEYEKKLAKYQDALALAQAEKRYNMRRQLAANTYRQKLIEVERMCDEELEKIKQNASSLQPLKRMVSQWYTNDHCRGDAAEEESPPSCSVQQSYSKSNFHGASNLGNKIDAEVNMAPEIFVSKFNSADENDFLSSTGTNFRVETTDFNRNKIAMSGLNSPLSLKWEPSNCNLPGNL